MTGGTPTDLDHVFGRWLEKEVRVEGCNGPDIVDCRVREFGHEFQRLFGYVAQLIFNRKQRRQHGDGRLRLAVDLSLIHI